MISRRLFWIGLLITGVLTGCSLPPPSKQTSTTQINSRLIQAHQHKLIQITEWSLSGRMALIQKKNDERDSFYINWEYQPQQQVLRFSHPLKGQLARLTIDDNGALLIDSEGNERWGPSAERLLFQLLHVAIPVDKLPHWILGKKSKRLGQLRYYPNGTLAEATVNLPGDTWQLQWFYDTQTQQELPLPEQVHLESPTLLIKVQIQAWQPTP